ncbi:MAG TPA: sigma-70 family RNA polymerase sigma factor [Solirubrobacteraceae bacterium]|jgi:RNA polymerase sigma factor (sigma-70 family)|nr:sigma-70 family RNA polymerase sigma factor [Solirubrobacteraceae bacterium]
MSPLNVRRYRAERLLRKEFEGLRGRVLGMVRGRLRASGVNLDPSDLEACYAQAWQGLYTAVLEGQEIENPTGWLTLVTFRRAIEEHRSRRRVYPTGDPGEPESVVGGATLERDFADELDDRIRLRQVFEGLRGRLSTREQQAASLCYLQGCSRSEAAAQMGISESRMRKLMEGPGAGRPGVAGKVGDLVETIRGGGWCEEQGSLMRGLAYGILDPEGERYSLALMHRDECPACRAYVLSLRGLAAVLPVPVLLPGVLGASALAGTGAGVGASAAAQAGSGAGGAQAGSGIGGALTASGGAGAGAAGGGWLLAGGPVGAKLAVGCLVALGVGASCVALTAGPIAPRHAVHRRHAVHVDGTSAHAVQDLLSPSIAGVQSVAGASALRSTAAPRSGASGAALIPAARASREFGPEQAFSRSTSSPAGSSSTLKATSARAASSGALTGTGEFTSTAKPASAGQPASSSSGGATGSGAGAAQHEFGIG